MSKRHAHRHGLSGGESIIQGYRAAREELTSRLPSAAAVAAIPGGVAIAAETTELALNHFSTPGNLAALIAVLAWTAKIGAGGVSYVAAHLIKKSFDRYDAAANPEPSEAPQKPRRCRTRLPDAKRRFG